MTIVCNQNIRWADISVDNILRMEVVKSTGNLSNQSQFHSILLRACGEVFQDISFVEQWPNDESYSALKVTSGGQAIGSINDLLLSNMAVL